MNLAILNTQQQEQKAIEEMKKYTDLLFMNSSSHLEDLPDKIRELLDDELFSNKP